MGEYNHDNHEESDNTSCYNRNHNSIHNSSINTQSGGETSSLVYYKVRKTVQKIEELILILKKKL